MNESKEMTTEEFKQKINNYPDYCPITGLEKCESYIIDGNVVYLPRPALDAYTLPEYDEEHQEFNRIHYDMDDDFRQEREFLCELEDLKNHPKLDEIKAFYKIN